MSKFSKPKRLSLKQKSFCEEFVNNKGNGTEAAVKSYNVKTRGMAAVIAHNNLKKPRVIQEIENLMDDNDITDGYMMQKLKEGLESPVVSSYKGEATETGIPDQNIRHKFFQDAAKMKGWLKDDINVNTANIDVEVENMSPQDIKRLLKQLLNETTQRGKVDSFK